MPVWLNTIPPAASKVPRPNTRRWLVALFIIFFIGFALTLWFWKTERTGFIFWFTAVGLPVCCWGMALGLRRMAYKMQQVSATTWNSERDVLIASEIKRGQRFAYLLDTYIETPAGQGVKRTLNAAKQSAPFVALQPDRSGDQHVRYAPLAIFDQADPDAMLSDIMDSIVKKFTPVLQKITPDIPCYCLVEVGNTLRKQTEKMLLAALKQQHAHAFRLISGQGMEAIDAWLDTRWNVPSLFLIVSIGYQSKPIDNDGEAISSILLSNRPFRDFPCTTRFHRPEKTQTDNLSYGLSQAVRWANIMPDLITGAWVAGQAFEEGGEWNQACEQNHLQFSLTKANKVLDSVFGNTERTAPWIVAALALASLNQDDPLDAQLLAVQPQRKKDDIWITVISHHTESKESVTHV